MLWPGGGSADDGCGEASRSPDDEPPVADAPSVGAAVALADGVGVSSTDGEAEGSGDDSMASSTTTISSVGDALAVADASLDVGLGEAVERSVRVGLGVTSALALTDAVGVGVEDADSAVTDGVGLGVTLSDGVEDADAPPPPPPPPPPEAEALETVRAYDVVEVPFCAVTTIVIVFAPTERFNVPEAVPDATVVPFTFTVDVASVTVGVTVTFDTPLETDDVYVVVAEENGGDRVHAEHVRLASEDTDDAARVTVTV